MLKHRHFISYFSTALVYLFGVSLFFYLQDHTLVSSKKSEEKVIEMCLCSFTPEADTPIEKPEETEAVEEVAVEEDPVVEKKTEVKPEAVNEPVREETPKIKEKVLPVPVVPKAKPKPAEKPAAKVVKKKAEKTKKRTAKKKQPAPKASPQKSKGSSAEKNLFLATIRDKINKHKSYPRIARKRGMQGTVKVTFTILGSGKVGNISVEGPKVFHQSARNAVKSAFPIDARNAPISLPKNISIALRYQVR